ncbi:MAG TPA: energy transducer TonB [Terriglobales bacterium]
MLAFLLAILATCYAAAQTPVPPKELPPNESYIGADTPQGVPPYHVRSRIKAPRAIYSPDPEYSKAARKAHYQGTVVLWMVVAADGRPHDIKVARSVGMGLDEKAIEAVKKWRFKPATIDGKPVAVQINVEVDFRL